MMIEEDEIVVLIGNSPTADKVAEQFTIQTIVDIVQHRQGGA